MEVEINKIDALIGGYFGVREKHDAGETHRNSQK